MLSLTRAKGRDPRVTPIIFARILRWWMSKKKTRCADRPLRGLRDTDRSGMHYLCFCRARKLAKGHVGRDISSGRRRYKSSPFSLFLPCALFFPLPDCAPPLVTAPQVVGLVRVIQGISAETDVGVDRRVSFSHPSCGPTICHSGASPIPFAIPDISESAANWYDRAW